MSRISFQTFAFAVVPQLERVVQCGSQYVFAVRRKLDKGDGWIIIVDKRFQTLSRGGVPDSTERKCLVSIQSSETNPVKF